jgi:hypothetical protein
MQNVILRLMIPIWRGVVEQKQPFYSQILVFRYFSKYCLSGFAILVGLSLKPLGLGAEFNAASDGTVLEGMPRREQRF